MCQFSSRTLVAVGVVCLVGATSAVAETPDLPPIEAPPEGTPPQSGAFAQPAAPAPAAAPDAGTPEFVIPMPAGGADTTPAAQTMQPAPAPAPAEAAPAAPGVEFTPTKPASATSASEAAPGETAKPSELPPEVLLPPVAAPPAAAPATASASSATTHVPATVTVPPVAAPAAPSLPDPFASDQDWHFRFQPFAAVGIASDLGFPAPTETTLPSSSVFTAGAAASVSNGAVVIDGRFSDSLYNQRYLTTQLATTGGLSTLDVAEQKMNIDLDVGYEVMHHMDPKLAKNVNLTPFVGGGMRLFLSDSLPMNFAGPEVGGRLAFALSSALVVSASYAFVPNLLNYQGPKLVLGTPKYDHTIDVDVSLRLFGAGRVRLSYLSEYLTLTSAYRSYQTVGVGFDYGF